MVRGGQEADRDGHETHGHQGDDQDVLASVAVTEVAEGNGADRAGNIADQQNGERQRRTHKGREVPEEQLGEHESSRCSVNEEVVHFHGASEKTGCHCSATLVGIAVRLNSTHFMG